MTSQGQRFRRRALRRGYKVDEVDNFLDRVEATLAGDSLGAPVSAQEVHDVVFRVRFGGYDEWQVDLHLDRVERQLAELEERGGAFGRGPEPRSGEMRLGPPADRMGGPDRLGPPDRMGLPDRVSAPDRMGPQDRMGPLDRGGPPQMPNPMPAGPGMGGPGQPPRGMPPVSGGPPTRDPGYGRHDEPTYGGGRHDEPTYGGGRHDEPTFGGGRHDEPTFGGGYDSGTYDSGAYENVGRRGRNDMTTEIRMGGGPGFGGPEPSFGGAQVPGGEVARIDQLRRTFQVRRFGSGYDTTQVDRFFDGVVASMSGRSGVLVTEAELGAAQFNLVPGGYFEAEVDSALKEVRDIVARRR